jgi:hypothetical protein
MADAQCCSPLTQRGDNSVRLFGNKTPGRAGREKVSFEFFVLLRWQKISPVWRRL